MPPVNANPVSIAVLAKAPIPGFANTRLIPSIGAHAAAVLQERMTERAVATAIEAGVGPVTLWGAPGAGHDTFLKMVVRLPIALRPQAEGDLGARMLAATAAGPRPVLVIGTDCPALTPVHLRGAARALRDEGADVVIIPAEDGGYVLIGTRAPHRQLFSGIAWSTPRVLAETRARVIALRLRLAELPPLWDVDTEADLARLEREHPELAV
jgi:rSAM/selenodomain-associated transferase 1